MFSLCLALLATAAEARPFSATTILSRDLPAVHVRDLRLFEPAYATPTSTRRPGMIADRELAPNAHVGLGLMSSSRRSNAYDWRSERRPPKRKLGLNFQLQF
jgi:hypothetical protein